MVIYVDIDYTICYYNNQNDDNYSNAIPSYDNIKKINDLFDNGNTIIYWSARGSLTKINWFDITKKQLDDWGCKYHRLSVGEKPPYDLLICDKTKRIDEI